MLSLELVLLPTGQEHFINASSIDPDALRPIINTIMLQVFIKECTSLQVYKFTVKKTKQTTQVLSLLMSSFWSKKHSLQTINTTWDTTYGSLKKISFTWYFKCDDF